MVSDYPEIRSRLSLFLHVYLVSIRICSLGIRFPYVYLNLSKYLLIYVSQ